MKKLLLYLFIILFPAIILSQEKTMAQDAGMHKVPAGIYHPFFKQNSINQIAITAYFMDETAVTNDDYLKFVKANPEWRRSNVSPLLAGKNYLRHWESDVSIGNKVPNKAPVVNVSWFAAKAYCEWKGKRLPTTAEWEYAAKGNPKGDKVESLRKYALDWNAKPRPDILPEVASTYENQYGLYDMNGLVWEWTFDFNNFVGSSDGSRGTKKAISFCGSGAVDVSDPDDYPAYLRYSFRSSLKGNYCISTLGFRCVTDLKNTK